MEKLLALTTIAERAYGMWLFQRLMPNIIVIAGLTMITSIMIAAMIIAGMIGGYFTMVNYGLEPHSALLCMSILALLVTLLLVICVIAHLQQLRRMPQKMLQEKLASTPKIGTMVSFIKGFMAK